MGMVMYLRRATSAQIEALKADPRTAEAFMFPEESDDDLSLSLIEFDKAWHALHFTLSGQAYGTVRPLGIIAGEDVETLGEPALGDISCWVIEPDVMAAFADAIDKISDEEIAASVDPEAMIDADIYLADVFADEKDTSIDYLMQGVPMLRRFAAICGQNGEGAIRCLA
ncbi:YfbM family protein [Sphingomonas sp. AP4-R1]|uniref:YfbM family protein n=1 Tax=Sphingomonas sp. AP4-R1 TaxID=2735134 RepID=UPI0014935469|nr:YfbM family protein [Sphingomonas sp. AP4-R1]QJU58647.1 YfbM family protein [Sphingomonas sp. AP4-R1]